MRNLLTDAKPFQWQDLVLHERVESWKDSLSVRAGEFEYLNRNGGEQQPLGTSARRTTITCVFLGADCTAQLRDLYARIERNPRGLLIHPRLGQWYALCTGVESSESPAKSVDMVEFTISFRQDEIDTLTQIERKPTAQQRAGSVYEGVQRMNEKLASILPLGLISTAWAAVQAAQAIFTQQAEKFAQDATQAGLALIPVPMLQAQLGRIASAKADEEAALRATGRSDAQLYPVLHELRVTAAATQDLYNDVIAQRPPVVTFDVPTAMSMTDVAVRLYGRDASAKMDELRLLNPQLRRAWMIPGGVRLVVSAPQPRQ